MNKNQDELREAKEKLKKKEEDLSKIHVLNEALSKEVNKLKKKKHGKGKWEKLY